LSFALRIYLDAGATRVVVLTTSIVEGPMPRHIDTRIGIIGPKEVSVNNFPYIPQRREISRSAPIPHVKRSS
jgi:hypothetical protein